MRIIASEKDESTKPDRFYKLDLLPSLPPTAPVVDSQHQMTKTLPAQTDRVWNLEL